MVIAIVMVLIVVASVLFHYLSPWSATPLASNWGSIDNTIIITLFITGLFFVVITLFMALAIYRYRHRDGARAHSGAESKKLEWWLIGLTTVGICGLLAPGLFVYKDFVTVPKDAAVIEALGQQWQWRFRLPGKDGSLGKSDVRLMTFDNPSGLDFTDPNSHDDVLVQSNEIHLPIDKPVKVLLRSKDVLHDFYVPQFRAKMDIVPGLVSYFWFTPTKLGKFEILCAEYCGVGHYNMRGSVVVDDEATYQQWLKEQPTFAMTQSKGSASVESASSMFEQGRQLAEGLGCFACHTTDGSSGVGPGWKDLYGASEKLADGTSIDVDDAYLRESILQPNAKITQGYPPVMVAYPLTDEELNLLIAFIRSLSATATEPSVENQAESVDNELIEQGKRTAQAKGCLACHSLDGSRQLGPSWKGLFGKTETLKDGSTILVDEAYFKESIVNPGAKVVQGYPPVMQSYQFSDEQLNALIAFAKAMGEGN